MSEDLGGISPVWVVVHAHESGIRLYWKKESKIMERASTVMDGGWNERGDECGTGDVGREVLNVDVVDDRGRRAGCFGG